ncbi:transposase family protein [Desulfitibacter alkalitolerans]|uniref:transposase family protein n=1 Tax=Desulfitibacter alkalitolerans TaxID=264641 RepID=UPI0006888DF9|nr:transposase family protein [Desulfitibacter alkalitolerans]
MNEAGFKRHERRRKQRELKEQQKKQGKKYPPTYSLPNRKCTQKTTEEEHEATQSVTEEKLRVMYQLLPGLLNKLEKIPDPRNPKKIKHQMTVMMLYGILMFMFNLTSRRQANEELTGPQLLENLCALFPELVDMPHQDTLCRLLTEIDVEQIESRYIDLVRNLIRKKKFQHLLYKKRYLVAIDGTQKYVMKESWDKRYLRRRVQGKDGECEYYAYVLEAVLVFSNGMVLPLMSEFLENSVELEVVENYEKWKQDCELKAFHRLIKRLKYEFPKLHLTLLLDGLYANGPVMAACYKNKWDFMIVLKDKSLPSVWKEAEGLMRLDTEEEYCLKREWQGRCQQFRWANGIEYEYGANQCKSLTIHVVVCEESWEDFKTGCVVIKTARHAWISSTPIDRKNVHERCNLTARKRWLQENNILKEKHQGYRYEHIFSHNWNAMKGYHYLMHIARMLNEMALHSVSLAEHVKDIGTQSFIKKLYIAMVYKKLDTERLHRLTESPGQLRLVQEENWKTGRFAA